MKKIRILAINPGSTSTKVSCFESEVELAVESLSHPASELKNFASIPDQCGFRLGCVENFLLKHNIPVGGFDAVVGRGGLLKPIQGGVYRVNPAMLEDLASGRYGEHSCNLGAMLADLLSKEAGCPAFIVDPVVVDELDDVARLSGLPEIRRISIFHALNQKSVAKQTAKKLGRKYEDCNFIVAHIGGGISVGAHKKGRVVDVNNALNGDGPFSPERSGGLPSLGLAELCFSGKFSLPQIKRKIAGEGGVVAYKGTNNFAELLSMAKNGDREAELLYRGMAYRISKEIAMHGATLEGEVDRIILTGGIANDAEFMELIVRRVAFLAPVEIIPGEREMLALAQGVLSAMNGEEAVKEYVR